MVGEEEADAVKSGGGEEAVKEWRRGPVVLPATGSALTKRSGLGFVDGRKRLR
jgi:hypothetical protein